MSIDVATGMMEEYDTSTEAVLFSTTRPRTAKTGVVEHFEPETVNPPIRERDYYGETDEHGQPVAIDSEESLIHCPKHHHSMTKRALDIVGSLCGLLILGPFIAAGCLAVWFKDGRGVLFRQRRVGRDGEVFTLLKIRTMCVDAEERLQEYLAHNRHDDHRTFKMERDPRVIPKVGEFLRRFSIDEFPQLWNVLRGDMSLVGPRPALPREVEHYTDQDRVRLCVKPGLTCYWQVGGRGHLNFSQQLELDIRYVEQCSLRTDLTLIAKTIPALMVGHGAE